MYCKIRKFISLEGKEYNSCKDIPPDLWNRASNIILHSNINKDNIEDWTYPDPEENLYIEDLDYKKLDGIFLTHVNISLHQYDDGIEAVYIVGSDIERIFKNSTEDTSKIIKYLSKNLNTRYTVLALGISYMKDSNYDFKNNELPNNIIVVGIILVEEI